MSEMKSANGVVWCVCVWCAWLGWEGDRSDQMVISDQFGSGAQASEPGVSGRKPGAGQSSWHGAGGGQGAGKVRRGCSSSWLDLVTIGNGSGLLSPLF